VRAQKSAPARKKKTEDKTPKTTAPRAAKTDADRKQEAFDLVVETLEALITERGEGEKIWGSMIKSALKRRKPGFNESYYGFKSFSALLEDARAHQLLELEREDKSSQYQVRLGAAVDNHS